LLQEECAEFTTENVLKQVADHLGFGQRKDKQRVSVKMIEI